MNKSPKRFFAIDLSSQRPREITDALVIFSMAILAYMSIAEWGGLTILHNVLGIEPVKPSFLYFFGMALVLFSTRRIGDQGANEQNAWPPNVTPKRRRCAIR